MSATNVISGLGRMSVVRQIAVMAALAASVALGVTIALWSRTPNYTLLYGSLGGKDASEVLEALGRVGMDVHVEEGSGAIMVATDKVHEARLMLAAEGLPRGTDEGFQMLAGKRSFGDSQFLEQARYQRALEVELARTVQSINHVQSARVHLALPRETSFLRDQKEPSASVLIKLFPGRKLEAGQADAIAHLVAAAIPNLEKDEVRIVDEQSHLLTAPHRDEMAAVSSEQFDRTRQLETTYIKRIEDILTPIIGDNGVRAQVTAELDFTRTEQARETYAPNPEAIRSEQVIEERGADVGAQGIPGALSNQPPGGSVLPETLGELGASGEVAAGLDRSRLDAKRNFELDRIVDHTVTPGMSIRRLSVAVVIDDRKSVDGEGNVQNEPRTEEEIARITALVKEAIGFDEERGDRVNVVNAAFTPSEVVPSEPLPEPPLWQRPWLLDMGKQVSGALVILILGLGVLRPLMRSLVNRDLAEREMIQSEATQRLALGNEPDGTSLRGERRPALALGGQDAPIDSIRALVSQDPKRVASMVKSWVDGNG